MSPQQTQNICITFIQCWTNVEDVGPTFYKCYTNVLCLLGRGHPDNGWQGVVLTKCWLGKKPHTIDNSPYHTILFSARQTDVMFQLGWDGWRMDAHSDIMITAGGGLWCIVWPFNPCNAEIFVYKPWTPRFFFNLKSSKLALSASFEYLCYGSEVL